MKTVLFIPGYYESIASRDYRATIAAIESQGFKVNFVPIGWARTTLKEWLDEFDKTYQKYDTKTTILAGFSFGAIIALSAAAQRNPAELWLFSLSPYFKEDIPKDKRDWRGLGHRRIQAFKERLTEDVFKSIRCPTSIYFGEVEAKKYPEIYNRSVRAHSLISNSKLITIPNSGHDVTNINYIETIKATLKSH